MCFVRGILWGTMVYRIVNVFIVFSVVCVVFTAVFIVFIVVCVVFTVFIVFIVLIVLIVICVVLYCVVLAYFCSKITIKLRVVSMATKLKQVVLYCVGMKEEIMTPPWDCVTMPHKK